MISYGQGKSKKEMPEGYTKRNIFANSGEIYGENKSFFA